MVFTKISAEYYRGQGSRSRFWRGEDAYLQIDIIDLKGNRWEFAHTVRPADRIGVSSLIDMDFVKSITSWIVILLDAALSIQWRGNSFCVPTPGAV